MSLTFLPRILFREARSRVRMTQRIIVTDDSNGQSQPAMPRTITERLLASALQALA